MSVPTKQYGRLPVETGHILVTEPFSASQNTQLASNVHLEIQSREYQLTPTQVTTPEARDFLRRHPQYIFAHQRLQRRLNEIFGQYATSEMRRGRQAQDPNQPALIFVVSPSLKIEKTLKLFERFCEDVILPPHVSIKIVLSCAHTVPTSRSSGLSRDIVPQSMPWISEGDLLDPLGFDQRFRKQV